MSVHYNLIYFVGLCVFVLLINTRINRMCPSVFTCSARWNKNNQHSPLIKVHPVELLFRSVAIISERVLDSGT